MGNSNSSNNIDIICDAITFLHESNINYKEKSGTFSLTSLNTQCNNLGTDVQPDIIEHLHSCEKKMFVDYPNFYERFVLRQNGFYPGAIIHHKWRAMARININSIELDIPKIITGNNYYEKIIEYNQSVPIFDWKVAKQEMYVNQFLNKGCIPFFENTYIDFTKDIEDIISNKKNISDKINNYNENISFDKWICPNEKTQN
jgi:hypothetical protein